MNTTAAKTITFFLAQNVRRAETLSRGVLSPPLATPTILNALHATDASESSINKLVRLTTFTELILPYSISEEIRSGTVVTYNDRQEILCQKCTDIALNEGEDETELGRSSESTNPSIERGERQVQVREREWVWCGRGLSHIFVL